MLRKVSMKIAALVSGKHANQREEASITKLNTGRLWTPYTYFNSLAVFYITVQMHVESRFYMFLSLGLMHCFLFTQNFEVLYVRS